jgi:heat shock protein HtpX
MKRVLLLIATNLAVMVVLGVVVAVVLPMFGYRGTLDATGGLNLPALLVLSAVVGFVGSFISLAMSKWTAKRMTGAQVIEQPHNADEAWLFSTVQAQAQRAGIGMPEIAVWDSPEVNAFATGMRRDAALVAVSTGLLRGMRREEVEAVLAHEISHVANGDMVTLTLIQGVVNTFVFFLSRVIGHFVDRVVLRSERSGYGPGYYLTAFLAQIVLGILASMIVMWFSRQREFRADAGGAALAGRDRMIAALERLKSGQESQLPAQLTAFGISGSGRRDFMRLFASHPSLDERIAALRSR